MTPRRRQRRSSLNKRLVIWSFTPTALILAIVALVAFAAYQQATADLAIERDRDLTRLLADRLALELESSAQVLEELTRNPDIYKGELDRQLAAVRLATNRLAMFDGGVVMLDAQGLVVGSEPSRPAWVGQDWHDRTWVSDCRLFRQSVFSNVLPEGGDGQDVIVLVVPILDADGVLQGELAGMFLVPPTERSSLYGGIQRGMDGRSLPPEDIVYMERGGELLPQSQVSPLARLFQHTQVASMRLKSTGAVYLVDGNGRAIYHTDSNWLGADLSNTVVVQQVLGSNVGAVRTRDSDGNAVVASYASLSGTPWHLVTEESWDELISYSKDYRSFLLALLALGVAVPALIVGGAVRRITDPIRQMIRAAEEVARGQFGRTVIAHTGDELEDLADQFNAMSSELQASYAHLERRVADRTQDLATLNAIARVTSRSLDLSEVLRLALARMMEALGFEAGEARSIDLDTGEDGTTIRSGLPPEMPPSPLVPPAPQTTFAGETSLWRIGKLPNGATRAALWQAEIDTIASVPLVANERQVGVINLATHEPRTLSAEEHSLLAAIGQQVGIAVENARLYDKARQLAVVEERNRLARELHDSVTQALYAITFYAEAAARLLAQHDTETAGAHLQSLGETAQTALQEMRLLIYELRPPKLRDEGLPASLQARLDAVEGRAGLTTRLQVHGSGALSSDCEQALYRIAMEALNNTLKHAHASTIQVGLDLDCCKLEICDDGAGFDPLAALESGGQGLRNMLERAQEIGATLQIISDPGQGTTIRLEVDHD